METDAPSQESDASGGLSTAEIALIISIVTLLFGSGIIFRLRKYIKKKICKRCSQGCGDEHYVEAESRVDNMEARQLSVPPAEQAAEGNTLLTDDYLMELARHIGREWKFLALLLGFTDAELDHIVEEERKVIHRILYVLQRWLQRTEIKDEREKVEFLCKALTRCGRLDLSEQVKSYAQLGF